MSEKVTYPVLDEGTLAAAIIVNEGEYVVVDLDGNVLGTTTIVDGGKTLKLPNNPSNRKWFNLATAEAAINEHGK